jgi:hypothetical protein
MQRLSLLLLCFSVATAWPQSRPTPLKAGDRIPSFHAMDQAGKERTFRDLAGPKGLVLFFHKSADW